jgi:hypothetical protein
VPLQPTEIYIKKLNPERRKITKHHVLVSLGNEARNFTPNQLEEEIKKFQDEAAAVILWGSDHVRIRMVRAAARVGLKVDGRAVDTFDDLKKSWAKDGGQVNVGKLYAICYGDYEGKINQQWSRELEIKYMHEQNLKYDKEPSLRDKGCYEVCISHAKGNMVRQIMNKSNATHGGKIALSLKNKKDLSQYSKDKMGHGPTRRDEGVFFLKKNVSKHMLRPLEEGRRYIIDQILTVILACRMLLHAPS